MALGQVLRNHLRTTQTEPGTGGTVYDLQAFDGLYTGPAGATVQGTVSTGTFAEALRFQRTISEVFTGQARFLVLLDIASVSADSEWRVRVRRYDGSGVLQATSSDFPLFTAAGVKVSIVTLSTTWQAGDRVGVTVEGRQTTGTGNRTITLNVNSRKSLIEHLGSLEGYGTDTSGGANGSLYTVTNLNDSGSGSLRDALAAGNRYIIFDVAGSITVGSTINFRADVTLDGFTAPSPGINLSHNLTTTVLRMNNNAAEGFLAHDIMVRNIRLRGAFDATQHPGNSNDGIAIGYGVYNVVLDHITSRNAGDGAIDIVGNSSGGVIPEAESHDITMQWCLLGDTRNMQLVNYGTYKLCFHHNAYVKSVVRNPYVTRINRPSHVNNLTVDFRNNLVGKWGSGHGTVCTRGAAMNVINNLYTNNGDGGTGDQKALIGCTGSSDTRPGSGECLVGEASYLYASGNVSLDPIPFDINSRGTLVSEITNPAPPTVTIQSALSAAHKVKTKAGMAPRFTEDTTLMNTVSLPPEGNSRAALSWAELETPSVAGGGATRPTEVAVTTGSVANALSGLTFAHTTPAGAFRLLVVETAHIGRWRYDTNVATPITYAGQNLTRLADVTSRSASPGFTDMGGGTGPDRGVEVWYLLNPPEGTHDVVFTGNLADASPSSMSCAARSFNNVDQTTPFRANARTGGRSVTSLSVAVTSTADDLVCDAISHRTDSGAVGAGQTESWRRGTVSTLQYGAGSREDATGVSTTMSWTFTAEHGSLLAYSLVGAPTRRAQVVWAEAEFPEAPLIPPTQPEQVAVVSGNVATATGLSLSLTVPGDVNRLLLVEVAHRGRWILPSGAVTYGGAPLTRLTTVSSTSVVGNTVAMPNGAGPDRGTELWYMINPPVGTADVSVDNTSITDDQPHLAVGARVFKKVDQTTPFGPTAAWAGRAQTSATVSVPSDPADLVVDSVALGNFLSTPASDAFQGAGQTLAWYKRAHSTTLHGGGSWKPGDLQTTETAVSWSWSPDGTVCLLGVGLKPAPAAPLDRRTQVSWAELELATTPPRRSVVTFAELEGPDPLRRARVTWAEAQAPDAIRRARVTWAEAELSDALRRATVTHAELETPGGVGRRAQITNADFIVPDVPTTPVDPAVASASITIFVNNPTDDGTTVSPGVDPPLPPPPPFGDAPDCKRPRVEASFSLTVTVAGAPPQDPKCP